MARVYVSFGSNIQPEENIRSGIAALKALYPDLKLSSVYKSKAMGFDGDDFYNLVAGFESESNLYSIFDQMKEIEARHNRTRKSHRFSSRTLDIDLLVYDEVVISTQDITLPRDEITRYAFVLCPLAEIAGHEIHPVTGISYEDLWRMFGDQSQQLHRIDFKW